MTNQELQKFLQSMFDKFKNDILLAQKGMVWPNYDKSVLVNIKLGDLKFLNEIIEGLIFQGKNDKEKLSYLKSKLYGE